MLGRQQRRGRSATIDECDWPTWGRTHGRSFSYACDTAISPDTVGDLRQDWFFATDDAVTATPAVVDGTVYVGDWSGRFYAIDLDSGELDWSFTAEPHAKVYAGQIVGSATVADVQGTRTVYVPSGETLYALRADDGEVRWERDLGRPEGDEDPTEIESSPAVVDGLVIVGTDVHNSPDGTAGGRGRPRRRHGRPPVGDHDRAHRRATAPRARAAATCGGRPPSTSSAGSCSSAPATARPPTAGATHSEALLALDLDTGERVWTYQPHEQNLDDLDFAGAPNLFEVDGRAVVGLGQQGRHLLRGRPRVG